ncbi:CopG family transcriptional regulator [Leekyejoonella antrihumi]|uniref:CopG family transcriptional regulator n=1 Tax=Leekyejoonella antrihumi TaxID=1660198 RepID=A0A563E8U5_9MICO|nr:CopG family transcriptional regulator [Leekyejoonella antrihumi]TWP38673.1 CopG family transcriptional regulator [Leekyejoonella antrihumi]
MSGPVDTEKRSVSMPAAICEAVRARVGSRGFSTYVVGAVSRQLQQDALDDILAHVEETHGPVEEAEVGEIMHRLAQ